MDGLLSVRISKCVGLHYTNLAVDNIVHRVNHTFNLISTPRFRDLQQIIHIKRADHTNLQIACMYISANKVTPNTFTINK